MKKVKKPAESVVLEFDFSSELDGIDAVSRYVTVYGDGTDPDIGTFYDGAYQVSGKKVLQRISAGISGLKYKVSCLAERGANKIEREDIIYVESR